MREIWFRGKRIGEFKNGKWAYGNLVWHQDYFRKALKKEITDARIIQITTEFVVEECDVEPKTVGEFTGLHDKNNDPIFEGDIVKCVANGKTYTDEELIQRCISPAWYRESEKPEATIYCKGEVVYIPEEGGWYIIEKSSGCEKCRTSLGFVIKNPFEDCTVIGNVYDNPELLE